MVRVYCVCGVGDALSGNERMFKRFNVTCWACNLYAILKLFFLRSFVRRLFGEKGRRRRKKTLTEAIELNEWITYRGRCETAKWNKNEYECAPLCNYALCIQWSTYSMWICAHCCWNIILNTQLSPASFNTTVEGRRTKHNGRDQRRTFRIKISFKL